MNRVVVPVRVDRTEVRSGARRSARSPAERLVDRELRLVVARGQEIGPGADDVVGQRSRGRGASPRGTAPGPGSPRGERDDTDARRARRTVEPVRDDSTTATATSRRDDDGSVAGDESPGPGRGSTPIRPSTRRSIRCASGRPRCVAGPRCFAGLVPFGSRASPRIVPRSGDAPTVMVFPYRTVRYRRTRVREDLRDHDRGGRAPRRRARRRRPRLQLRRPGAPEVTPTTCATSCGGCLRGR